MNVIFIQDGRSIDYKPTNKVSAGDVVLFGTGTGAMVGVATQDIPANTLGAVAIEGVFDFPSAEGISVGIKAYLSVEGKVTGMSSGNTPLGRTVASNVLGDTTRAKVKINVP